MAKNNTKDENYYISSDLGCSAALLASGFNVINIDKSNPKRAYFRFIENEEILNAVEQYWSGSLLVSARSLIEASKSLKSRLYGE